MEQNPQSNSKRGILIVVTIVILALIGVVVYALQTNQSDETAVNSETTQTEPTPITPTTDEAVRAPNDTTVITFTDDGFSPQEVTVKVGTIISVQNESSSDVQFSSDDHPAHLDNREMNLNTAGPGEKVTYTATKTGTWGFHDHIDDRKTGTITVTE